MKQIWINMNLERNKKLFFPFELTLGCEKLKNKYFLINLYEKDIYINSYNFFVFLFVLFFTSKYSLENLTL